MANVQVFLDSELGPSEILDYGFAKVILATGGRWRRDGIGRWRSAPIPGLSEMAVFGPEDVFAGQRLEGPVVIYDDDRYYLGGLLAEKLRLEGLDVALVTPAAEVSGWTRATLEQGWIEKRLHDIGVTVIEKHAIAAAAKGEVGIQHVLSGRECTLPCSSLLLVTMRLPSDSTFQALTTEPDRLQEAGIRLVTRIGDCLAPSTIAAAVYAGHRCAREIDTNQSDEVPFKRELIALE
jgi:dimethylamine/trimethylamine dehydrogenase